MNPGEITTLGGTLVRWGKDKWAWKNHKPEPRVRDLTLSTHYNFRCSNYRGTQYVEVMVKAARDNDDLSWVVAGGYETGHSGDHAGQMVVHADGRITRRSETGKAIPQVYMVPWEDWEKHNADPIGATWDIAVEEAIFSIAESLGWVRPPLA